MVLLLCYRVGYGRNKVARYIRVSSVIVSVIVAGGTKDRDMITGFINLRF